MIRDVFLVATGGALGATARFLVSRAVLAFVPGSFPWGTFLINVTGCLMMGVVAGLGSAQVLSPGPRLFLATGILGGYTTFSAFGLEAQQLMAADRMAVALAYTLGQLVLGVACVYLGLALARRFQ